MPKVSTRVCTPPNSAGTHPSRRKTGRVCARAGPEIGRKSVKFRDLASQKCQVSPLKIGPFFVTTRVPPATFCENGVFQIFSPFYDVFPNSGAVFARPGTLSKFDHFPAGIQEEITLPRARVRACARARARARARGRGRGRVRVRVCACACARVRVRVCACSRTCVAVFGRCQI